MPFNTELTDELNLLLQFNLKNEQDGIKIHNDANAETISAAGRLHSKGLISQADGGYLTDLGRKAAEHAQDLTTILR
ncbi:MAG TPA: TIGR02647 family protein [Leucothrix mucor]|nr:TIGR02647 family protein [Leucothrix mucor]